MQRQPCRQSSKINCRLAKCCLCLFMCDNNISSRLAVCLVHGQDFQIAIGVTLIVHQFPNLHRRLAIISGTGCSRLRQVFLVLLLFDLLLKLALLASDYENCSCQRCHAQIKKNESGRLRFGHSRYGDDRIWFFSGIGYTKHTKRQFVYRKQQD